MNDITKKLFEGKNFDGIPNCVVDLGGFHKLFLIKRENGQDTEKCLICGTELIHNCTFDDEGYS